MDNFEDLTQKERIESGLLGSLLGQPDPRTAVPASLGSAAPCPVMPRNEANGMDGGPAANGCGHCSCGCGESDHRACGFGVEGGVLAAVWSPLNMFEGIYDVPTALRRGTMFRGLDKPFYGDGGEVRCRGEQR